MTSQEKDKRELDRKPSGDYADDGMIQARKIVPPRKDVAQPAAEEKLGALAEHTVAAGETLSGIAQHYYGHATREYFMVIYEANKGVIGDDPGKIKPGMILTIPPLPDALKK